MKKSTFTSSRKAFMLSLVILCGTIGAWAQYPSPYLSDDTRPDGTKWIPEPPSAMSGAFANDYYYYQWGKSQRDGDTGQQALSDESEKLCAVFSESLGIEISPTATPEIYLLVEFAVTDAYWANKKVKDYYQRRRPFATFNEPSLKPEEDAQEASTFSYPSGHSTRGWMYALVLTTLAPERTEFLMERARDYSLNRVVCGHHWKSDIDASLMLTSGIFANIVVTEAFQAQLMKARAEYLKIKNGSSATNIQNSTTMDPAQKKDAAVYNLQGQPVNKASTHGGIYVQNGRKFVMN